MNVTIDLDTLSRLWREVNQAGLEGRQISRVQLKGDWAHGVASDFELSWTPAPRRECGCDMCRR